MRISLHVPSFGWCRQTLEERLDFSTRLPVVTFLLLLILRQQMHNENQRKKVSNSGHLLPAVVHTTPIGNLEGPGG